ncbi:survival motor neuron protein [Drosophila kikkawai]|uniref:Survival motor neuron protein n=1 Tax=Drosophila kikkawai TaxID=30033 RepID=A0A6P4J3M2_DROKI|nr:survival motor neuron protein [Drosophila kikkawai]
MSDEVNNDAWDDSLLVKFYDENVGLAREELARRLADSTNKREQENASAEAAVAVAENSSCSSPRPTVFEVGDFARATYNDGLDYEGVVVSVDEKGETCTIRYLGYENTQEVLMTDLLPSWGKQVRREQFLAAKNEEAGEEQPARSKASTSASAGVNPKKSSSGKGKTSAGGSGGLTMPPMPPLPPMFTSQNEGGEQDVVAMLTAWYMSGYYTGLYQGKKEANAIANANAKKKTPKK